jgi:hypothetical protein
MLRYNKAEGQQSPEAIINKRKVRIKIMLNYYDEVKNDIMEVLEDKRSREYMFLKENKDLPEDTIYDYLIDYLTENDSVTGNISGSYYFSSYKSRKHCYNYFRDVFEALEEYDYKKELQKFKIFVSLVEYGYLNIENMTLDYELLEEVDEDERYSIFYAFEEIEGLDFESIDVITRCYKLYEVVADVVEEFLK